MIEKYSGQQAEFSVCFEFEASLKKEVGVLGIYLGESTNQVIVSLGEKEKFTSKIARRACAKAVAFVKSMAGSSVVIDFAPVVQTLGEAGVLAGLEGINLSLFEAENWKSNSAKKSFTVYIDATEKVDDIEEKIIQVSNVSQNVLFARQLVNAPANFLTPLNMAKEMVQAAEKCGIETTVLNEQEMRDLGMNALLTVGTSSGNPPCLIVLRYNGDPASEEKIALVGKGVTADTGGYCLKPANSMKGIRGDMGGAAAACGAILSLAQNKVPVNVVTVIPAAENRISDDSFIPGDVIFSMAGKSIEIGNTDAEGRLLLADALTYAIEKENATRIVDLATLTGAVVGMFGFTTAGAVSNDDLFYEQFERAYATSDEQYWRLPIFPEYEKMIESPVADLSNMSNDGCGTITAALFVGAFNQGLPWIHLDIAGTAWVDSPKWEFQSVGATGAGVTTLYELCKLYARKG